MTTSTCQTTYEEIHSSIEKFLNIEFNISEFEIRPIRKEIMRLVMHQIISIIRHRLFDRVSYYPAIVKKANPADGDVNPEEFRDYLCKELGRPEAWA